VSVARGPVLEGQNVVLRPAGDADIPALVAIVSSPEVARWWGTPRSEEEFAKELLDEDVVTFAIEVGKEVIGLIQYYEENEPDYRSAGVDISLRPDHLGRGLGTDAVRTIARYLFDEREHHRLTIDPAAANERAIACYRKVGFQPVGVMRRYERGADGSWHDGLLMDLLREEFSSPVPNPVTAELDARARH
jgi:aminoglycoside 6'-N-acetyltransferase